MIQLPGKKIRNVTSDWNDGILLATLVDSVARGLCPECDEMLPEKALQNVTHAMTLAEDWLSVPQVTPLMRVHMLCILAVWRVRECAMGIRAVNQASKVLRPRH